ncbi:MAG: DUF3500 domain-containing protein [Acidobacteriota bacterium]
MNWRFIPVEDRKGVALREMTSAQKHLAEALLSSALSNQGIIKAHTIMSLDQVLKEREAKQAKQPFERDPEKDYVTIFGEAVGARHVGLPFRRPSRGDQLYDRERQDFLQPELLRSQSRRGARRTSHWPAGIET